MFEAVEQARIDAIGSNALMGVRANLNAVLETAVEQKGLNRFDDPTAAPMADIVGLLVRERLTGDAAARRGEDAGRPASAPRSKPRRAPTSTSWPASIEDQAAFAPRRAHDHQATSISARTWAMTPTDSGESDTPEMPRDIQEDAGEEQDDQDGEGAEPDPTRTAERDAEGSEEQSTEAEADEDAEMSDDDAEMGDGEKAARPDFKDPGKREPPYKVFTDRA